MDFLPCWQWRFGAGRAGIRGKDEVRSGESGSVDLGVDMGVDQRAEGRVGECA